MPGNIKNAVIELIDIKGNVVDKNEIYDSETELKFDVSALREGTYFCILRYGNEISQSQKIVVVK